MDRQAIELLRCGGCGAVVPLGDADTAVCPFCKATTPIPDEQRSSREAVRADTVARKRATALYREIGKPPSAIVRVLGFVSPAFLLTGGFVLVLVVSYLLFFVGGGAIGHAAFRVELQDVVSARWQVVAPIGLAIVLGLIGLVLSAYARRRAISLREVQAGLAAHPATRSGGPSTCRACGAPLTVLTDANGIACDYCGADNLVNIPSSWIQDVVAGARQLDNAIELASEAHRAEMGRLRGILRVRVIVWALVAAIVGAVLALGLSMRDPLGSLNDWPPNWSVDVHGDRTMHAHRTSKLDQFAEPIHPDKGLAPRCEGPWLDDHQGAWSSPAACDDRGCRFRWIVALRHGERLRLRTLDLPAKTRLQLYRHVPGGTFEDGDFVAWRSEVLDPDASPVIEIPRSGWYALGLEVLGQAPDEGRSFCATLE